MQHNRVPVRLNRRTGTHQTGNTTETPMAFFPTTHLSGKAMPDRKDLLSPYFETFHNPAATAIQLPLQRYKHI